MTERQLRRLARIWAGRLGLEQWDLHLEIAPPEDDSVSAQAFRSNTYEQATLRFSPWLVGRGKPPDDDWPGRPWDDHRVEVVVVHELLHLAVRDMRMAAELEPLEEILGKNASAVWGEGMRRAEEQAVDRLAWALVRATPAR